MAREYLTVDGKLLMSDGKLVQVPDPENINDLADSNVSYATLMSDTVDNVEDLIINGVIDGSPKGVYANLSALQTTLPNGASGVYLTSDNGHWYFWNDTAWTDGGLYRSDPSYDEVKKDISHYVKLCEFSVQNTFIDTNGNAVTNAGYTAWHSTDFEEIGKANKLVYKLNLGTNFSSIAFYDSNKNFISSLVGTEAGIVESEISPPKNAMYYRACYNSSVDENYYVKQVIDSTLITKNNEEINSNFIKNADFSIDGYINGNGEVVLNNTFAKITDYIPIDKSNTIYFKLYSNDYTAELVVSKIGLIVFYDSNKSIINTFYSTGITGFYEGSISVPNNAKYYRACRWNVNGDQYCYTKIDIFGVNRRVCELEEVLGVSSNIKYKYGDSLLKPFNFNGKSLVAFGDSITAGVANEGSGNIGAGNDAYIVKFASLVNATLINQAVSGSTITFTDNETISSIYTKITTYSGSPDFIIISGGTNDYNQGKTLGAYGDDTKYTFYGALKLICEYLKTNFNNTKVIFITPINVTKDFNGHDKSLLNNYRNAIYEVATKYEYNVVNGADLLPVTLTTGWDNNIINSIDGCHPTKAGHRLYARNLCGKLL